MAAPARLQGRRGGGKSGLQRKARCRVIPGGGNPRESATENRLPRPVGEKVKRWGKSPPRDWQQKRHGKPHREQCQIGGPPAFARRDAWTRGPRVGSTRSPATVIPDEWPSIRGRPRGTESGLQAIRAHRNAVPGVSVRAQGRLAQPDARAPRLPCRAQRSETPSLAFRCGRRGVWGSQMPAPPSAMPGATVGHAVPGVSVRAQRRLAQPDARAPVCHAGNTLQNTGGRCFCGVSG